MTCPGCGAPITPTPICLYCRRERGVIAGPRYSYILDDEPIYPGKVWFVDDLEYMVADLERRAGVYTTQLGK